MKNFDNKKGFTLIELIVVVSIISILATIVYASFDTARQQARDKTRMAALKEMQLGIELYKAQTGVYPVPGTEVGCNAANFNGPGPVSASGYSSCDNYINGLSPSFVPALSRDPKSETVSDQGFYYRSDGLSYKLIIKDSVETLTVSGYASEFARCPKVQGSGPCSGAVPANTYAVYSAGAEAW